MGKTAWAGRGRRRRRELEPHRGLFHGHLSEVHDLSWWERRGDARKRFMSHHNLSYRETPQRRSCSSKLTMSLDVLTRAAPDPTRPYMTTLDWGLILYERDLSMCHP